MGLFDGPAVKFAQRFSEYLDERAVALRENVEKARELGDNYTMLCDSIMANTLTEISNALKFIVAE